MLWLIFIFFTVSGTVSGQQITINGKIIGNQNVEVEGIHIFNLSSGKGVISDEKGHFQIPVSLNDTISISAIHIQENVVVIGEEQVKSKKLLIDISEKDNLLNTVTIRKGLSGYLGSDANTIPLKEIVTASSLGLPNADLPQLSKSERMLYTASSGPVDLLVNTLTGERKRIKKRIELEKKNQLTENLLDKFPMSFFVDVLNIPEFKVYRFLQFCEDDPDYKTRVTQETEDIVNFLRVKSTMYLQKINSEPEGTTD